MVLGAVADPQRGRRCLIGVAVAAVSVLLAACGLTVEGEPDEADEAAHHPGDDQGSADNGPPPEGEEGSPPADAEGDGDAIVGDPEAEGLSPIVSDVAVDDLLPETNLAELVETSDVVVYGQVVETRSGDEIGGPESVGMTLFTVAATEVLRGDPVDTMDVALLTHVAQTEIEMEGRPTPSQGDHAIWFLAAVEEGFGSADYVLTNQQGLLLVDDSGSSLAAESLPAAGEELGSVNLDAVLAHLRSLPG